MCLEVIQPIQEPIDKKSGWRQGTVATCSGAGVVWMAIPMRGWVQPPAMRNGDCLKVILPLSNFTRALEQPEQRRTEELLNTVEWSARSWVQAWLPPKIFLAIFHLWNSRNHVCTFPWRWSSFSAVSSLPTYGGRSLLKIESKDFFSLARQLNQNGQSFRSCWPDQFIQSSWSTLAEKEKKTFFLLLFHNFVTICWKEK